MSTITPLYRNLQSLLQSQSFCIDEYQREYKWEKENIDELLTDLQEKFLSGYQPGDETKAVAKYEDYFLGSIIISKRNGQNYLIDGQQRVAVRFPRGCQTLHQQQTPAVHARMFHRRNCVPDDAANLHRSNSS